MLRYQRDSHLTDRTATLRVPHGAKLTMATSDRVDGVRASVRVRVDGMRDSRVGRAAGPTEEFTVPNHDVMSPPIDWSRQPSFSSLSPRVTWAA